VLLRPIPRSPRPSRILAGLVVALIGALALWQLRLAPSTETWAAMAVLSIALVSLGLLTTISGALHRERRHARCRRCHKVVTAWRGAMGWLCPESDHYARLNGWPILATLGFWLASLIGCGVLAVHAYWH
jgi:hypothetical protein